MDNLKNMLGAGRGRIIVVDDDDLMLNNLQRILSFYDFSVIPFHSAKEALFKILVDKDSYDAILTDLNMPEMNGIEFIQAVKKEDPDAVPIFLTGYSTSENAIGALRAGAFDFLEKPFSNEHLAMTLDKAVEMRRLRRYLEAYRFRLEELLEERTSELRKTLKRLEGAYMTTLEVIISLLEVREPDTAQHSRRVSERTLFLAKQSGITDKVMLESIRRGALLHDIGKIGIPDAILKKPGRLTPEEMDIMRTHALIGFNIINTIPDMEHAADIVRSHHERFDGKGYPRQLAGKDICVGARLFSIIDTYDALRFDRCYHKGIPMMEACAEIEKNAGTQFDPEIIAVFKSNIEELDKIF